jgi:uncharacterized membrane protein (DUF2068 family)
MEPRPVGIRLIVLYKTVKAVAELVLAIVLMALAASGEIETLRRFALELRENLASRWSLLLGRALVALASPRGIHLAELGLVLDGIVSGFEGFSLARGYRWGPWLVLIATATPLPLEIFGIAQTPRPSRIVLAIVNLAVVVYLARDLSHRGPSARRGGRRGPD